VLLLLAALADLEPIVTLPTTQNQALSVELRDGTDANRRYSIARVPAPTDCTLRLERLTMHDAVLACVGEKMDIHPHLKFVFDPRAKALVRHFTYMPYAFTGKGLVASNGTRTVRVMVEPGGGAVVPHPGRPAPGGTAMGGGLHAACGAAAAAAVGL